MKITKRRKMGGRILALLMSCCLLLGLFPGTVAATEGADEGELVLDKWVEEAEDGFKLVLESYATGSNDTVTTEPRPVDIVLVLDESGSMNDVLLPGCDNKNGTDVTVTPRGHLAENVELDDSQMDTELFVGHKVFSNGIDKSKIYTVVYPANGTTRDITYCKECRAWYSNTNHADHGKIAKWIPFGDENGTPTEIRTEDIWTCTVQFYEECGQTGRDVLQAALRNFLNTLYDASNPDEGEQVENRVAIVGYGKGASYITSDGVREEVYDDPGDGPGGSPINGYEESAEDAWCTVAGMEESSIDTWVNGIHAEGSTPTHLGIQAAELAFENAPETEDENRAKVMILFTDGTPGANYNNYGPNSSSRYPDWVTPGIQSAKAMKDDGVTIYSVGLFPDANGYDAEEISYNVDANGDGSPADGFFGNANCFLHVVSSNYPDATGIDTGERGDLSRDYIEDQKSYYLGTSNAEELSEIFEQISEDVTPGSTTVQLDETAIVKDKITDDFRITYADGLANVTAYTMSYRGEGEEWTKDVSSVSTVSDKNAPDKLHITVNGQTVEVTNFDFAGNYVHLDEHDKPMGKKLVIEILIEPTDATSGGTKLPTNVMDNTNNAGIYGPNNDRPVAQFPLPHVDLSTTVTVKKEVKGSDSTKEFSFEAAYIEAGDYENLTAEQSGGAGDSNYLHFEEGTSKTDKFTLADGGTYALENVEVGSTLTISEEAASGWGTPTVTTSTGTQALTPDDDGKYTVTVTPGIVITFTNTKEPDDPGPSPDPDETINISGSKTWDDNDNQDGKRPESITIRLYANGEQVDFKTVTAEDDWKWTFEDLPKYANGEEIDYSISEEAVPDYTTSIDGYNVTNSYTPDHEPGPDPEPEPEPTTGSLTISKTVRGYAADTRREFQFRVELDPKINGSRGGLDFKDGVAYFTLAHGESITISGLEEDTEYIVTELDANEDGYTANMESDSGIIDAGRTDRVEFVNSYITPDEPDPGIPEEPDPDIPDEPDVPGEPDTPDEPDVPNEPGTPDEPDVPSEPDTPDEPDTPNDPGVPQTSDSSMTWLWSALCLFSLGVLGLLHFTAKSAGGKRIKK